MKKHKHTPREIATKLHQADALVAEGKLHSEVARALGVSIMTYHRWRKSRGTRNDRKEEELPPTMGSFGFLTSVKGYESIEDLKTENARLRNLFTDLVLEKIKLEEELQALRAQKK